jgi:glycosyltransferase involved in cell wall biosynthesis
MRLLHVHSGNLYGGVETMMLAMAHSGPAPVQNEFALCFDGLLATRLRNSGASVHLLGAASVRHPLSIIRSRRRLRLLLEAECFDAGICHMPWAQAIFGFMIWKASIPLVFWMHDVAFGHHWLEWWARRVPPDLVISNSYTTASSAHLLYPQVASDIIYPPVNLERYQFSENERRPLREEFATSQDAVVILQASRIEKWKGHELLIDALRRLTDLPSWTVWIAGAPQRDSEMRYFEMLKEHVVRAGIADRVRFCGQQDNVPRLMSAVDIYCQPNLRPEPFGIVFIEALNQGLPVVATAIGGAAEIIEPQCGVLTRPGDASDLADTLRRLISDASLRKRLGSAGPARASALCAPTAQMERLKSTLERLMESNRHSLAESKGISTSRLGATVQR